MGVVPELTSNNNFFGYRRFLKLANHVIKKALNRKEASAQTIFI